MTTELDEKAVEFLARIDHAVAVSKLKRDSLTEDDSAWKIEYYDRLITNLTDIRRRVFEGLESRVSRGQHKPGTGMGMGMWLGEWCEDREVIYACRAVEDYFRYEY